jgi:hypothetical protein
MIIKENKQYLLREFYEMCPDGRCGIGLLNESEQSYKNEGFTLLTGKMQTANKKNANGRIYKKPLLEREMQVYQKLVSENRAYGELDHPSEAIVEAKNASHRVLRTWWDGDDVMGVVLLMNTRMGKDAQAIVESGGMLGISSRALGSLRKESDALIVEDDLQLICFDLVTDPSTDGAFMMQDVSVKQIQEIREGRYLRANSNNRLEDLYNQILN